MKVEGQILFLDALPDNISEGKRLWQSFYYYKLGYKENNLLILLINKEKYISADIFDIFM